MVESSRLLAVSSMCAERPGVGNPWTASTTVFARTTFHIHDSVPLVLGSFERHRVRIGIDTVSGK